VKRTVLVVDDDPLILRVVSTVLDLEEFEVVTATSASEALDELGRQVPAVMVTDIMMPEMDGLELCQHVRADPRTADLPVVLLTAKDTDGDRAAGIEAGGDAYLTKPFSPLELIEAIESLLEGRD
jgi:CheY-like chemotaxis protein